MRFSKKLKTMIDSIIDVEERRQVLSCIYIHSTPIDTCSRLFGCSEDIIVQNLIYEQLYKHKICTKCGKLRSFDLFYTSPGMVQSNRTGVSSICRRCVSSNGKNYWNNNRERKRAYEREYIKRDYVKEKRLSYQKEYLSIPEKKRSKK